MSQFLMCYGPEFAAAPFQDWLRRVGIQPIRIYPGSPWENGYNERFNGTLRREVLNAEWFTTTRQAQVVIDTWLRQYNHVRPHNGRDVDCLSVHAADTQPTRATSQRLWRLFDG